MLRAGERGVIQGLKFTFLQTRGYHGPIPIPVAPSRAVDPTFEGYHQCSGTFDFARSRPWARGSTGILEGFPSLGSMQLMAVPKRKVTPSRKRIRNAPKALKPAPVIIRCKSCGRVKLPHFFCCTGDKINEEGDSSTK
uniref:Large ribosomal subunit protein bL32m n=1 Tax=Araucaria cunninghamii TaxID=56994 RepID=A0A0D6R6Y4_ARACU